jgi:hypothetical protein
VIVTAPELQTLKLRQSVQDLSDLLQALEKDGEIVLAVEIDGDVLIRPVHDVVYGDVALQAFKVYRVSQERADRLHRIGAV